jgi:hypothetical protein
MKKSEMMVLLIACLLFAIGMPSKTSTPEYADQGPQKQEQQAEEAEPEVGMAPDESYHVIYKSKSVSENKIADVIWLKEAAKVALDAGIPYFNVIHQKTRREFDPHQRKSFKVVEGRIRLDNDPMASQYDANEIMSLVLTNKP